MNRTLERQRETAGANGLSYLEHRLLLIMDANRTVSSKLVQAYKAGQKPSDSVIAAFMRIPAVSLMRVSEGGEYADVEIVKALADVIETVLLGDGTSHGMGE